MTVKWYGRNVLRKLDAALDDLLDEVATEMNELAGDNIRANDQIDTGYMHAARYVVTPKQSTYARTWTPGLYYGSKSGQLQERERAPEIQRTKPKTAIISDAAVYALFPELANSYLYRAAMQMVGARTNEAAKRVGRRHFG